MQPTPLEGEGIDSHWRFDGEEPFVADVRRAVLGLRARSEEGSRSRAGGRMGTAGLVATVWGEPHSWYSVWREEKPEARPRIPSVHAALAFMEDLVCAHQVST